MRIAPRKILVFFILGLLMSIIFHRIINNGQKDTDKFLELKKQVKSETPLIEQTDIFYDNDVFLSAVQKNRLVEKKTDIEAVITPHHLLASDIISLMIKKASGRDINSVIVIGPNHENLGDANIIACKADWQTPFGKVQNDALVTDNFLNVFNQESRHELFKKEHSIGALMPFLKHYLPGAKVTPIILNSYTSYNDIRKLNYWLSRVVDKKTLIVYSIDFSHYLTIDEANRNDLVTRELIESQDIGKIMELNNDYVDSPAVLSLSLIQANKRGLEVDIVKNKNSFSYSAKKPVETTSYFGISFKNKLTETKDEKISFLFFGDLMLDRYVETVVRAKGFDYLFEEIIKKDKNFFSDYDIVSANLEGTVTNQGEYYPPQKSYDFAFQPEIFKKLKDYSFNFFSLANNHIYDQGERGYEETKRNLENQGLHYSGCNDARLGDCSYEIMDIKNKKIGMVGLSMVARRLPQGELKKVIKEVKEKSDVVVVNVHWGSEYEKNVSEIQKEYAHLMIDSGADLIIGHHPHVVQEFEEYKGKYVFYSLGNFIFDQYFSDETQKGIAVKIELENKKIDYEIFPFRSQSSQVFLEDKES